MDTVHIFLQHYWWFIISLLGALLVFLLFVQGGQAMLYTIGRTETERNLIVNSLGRKWELTFTTLVTFGGAFFASFPLFYSTSFGGAFYVWMLILLVFVIQAVSYEYRRKPSNFLGEKTFNAFLIVNGIAGTFLLGTAVGTLFFGAQFTVDRANFASTDGFNTISQWATPWYGLDALADPRNILLGLAVLFLSRVLGLLYFMNNIDEQSIFDRSRRHLRWNAAAFVATFVAFLVTLLLARGWAVDPASGRISEEPYKYLHNLLAMPVVFVLLVAGILSVLWGIAEGLFRRGRRGIWFAGAGTVLNAVVGIAGLDASLAAIESGHDLALANKESLVTGGHLVTDAVKKHGVHLLPVDSEHSAIFQCLQGCRDRGEIKRLILTCSGGPFYGLSAQELATKTKADALKHPNWTMGAKITIDSATLMNKGLEIIEAMRLYRLPLRQVDAVIHRQSIVHSLVEFHDGAMLAQLGTPDMKLPIRYAMTYPNRAVSPAEPLDLLKCPPLTFAEPDEEVFRCLKIAKQCAAIGNVYCAAMNGANEEAVAAFLCDEIGICAIPDLIEAALDKTETVYQPQLSDILEADRLAREVVREKLN